MQRLTDADSVVEAAEDYRFNLFPAWSVDFFLCHPDEAKKLCVQVRRELGRRLEDHEILWAMLNGRKRGKTKPAKGGDR